MQNALSILSEVCESLRLAESLTHQNLKRGICAAAAGATEEALGYLRVADAVPPSPIEVVESPVAEPVPPPPTSSVSFSPIRSSPHHHTLPEPSVVTSSRGGSTYTDFASRIHYVLRKRSPGTTFKTNLPEIGRLWKAHKHLRELEEIVAAATREIEAAAPAVQPQSVEQPLRAMSIQLPQPAAEEADEW